jgi:queuine/archaeosine tRNA-ribosyltransferase
MVSLLALAEINEDGVNFRSPHDGTQMLLTLVTYMCQAWCGVVWCGVLC